MSPVLVPCSPSAHARIIRLSIEGDAPSMCAVDPLTDAISGGGGTSKLGPTIPIKRNVEHLRDPPEQVSGSCDGKKRKALMHASAVAGAVEEEAISKLGRTFSVGKFRHSRRGDWLREGCAGASLVFEGARVRRPSKMVAALERNEFRRRADGKRGVVAPSAGVVWTSSLQEPPGLDSRLIKMVVQRGRSKRTGILLLFLYWMESLFSSICRSSSRSPSEESWAGCDLRWGA